MEILFQVVGAIGAEIFKAVTKGDWSVFDKPVRELVPDELATTLAKKRAEIEAAMKFGPRS